MEEIIRIEIPNFARQVKVSNARKARHYKFGENIPERFEKAIGSVYTWKEVKGKTLLARVDNGELVVKNPKTAGTPRYEQIAGNSIWDTGRNGDYMEMIKLSVQKYMWDVIQHFKHDSLVIKDELLPLRVTMDFHTYMEPQDFDGLKLFYEKCFLDAIKDQYTWKEKPRRLLETRWVREDNTKIIKSLHMEHHDCFKGEDKLVITVTSGIPNKVINYTKDVPEFNFTLNVTK